MFLLNFYHGDELAVGGVALDDRVTVGRSAGNTVVLPDPSVSRRHAVFLVERTGDESLVIIQDLGSTNGCDVNGSPFRNKRMRVQPEDSIRLGNYRVELLKRTPALSGFVEDEDRTIVYQGPPLSHESLPLDRLRALHELTAAAAGLEIDELLEATWKTVFSCLRYDVLCILVQEAGGTEVVRTWNADGACPATTVPISRKLIGKCMKDNLAVLADRQGNNRRLNDDSSLLTSVSCTVCVPLTHGDWNFGAIYVSSDTKGVDYDKDDLEFLILTAHQVSNTIANRKAVNDLRTEATKLEAILASLQEGVIVADKDFVILSANSAARKALGNVDVRSKTIEEALSRFEHTFDRATIADRHRFQVAPGPTTDAEAGGPRIYSATVSENVGPDHDNWKYVVCLHDVTHVQRTERMKSMFVNRLAHKLRTPLTVITGVNALVVEQAGDGLDPELRELMVQSLENADQCAALIERFVEYTSLNLSGEDAASCEACRVEDLVRSAAESNHDLIAKKRFTIVTGFPEETFHVRGKKENLAIVFQHIVQNAVKFGSPSGSLLVSASEARDTVRISFVDDGPGIPGTELENLGQMLHQVDLGNTGQVPGAGLGLWIARAILQSSSGDIRIASPVDAAGGGTRVDILLPACRPRETPEPDYQRAYTETVQLDGSGATRP